MTTVGRDLTGDGEDAESPRRTDATEQPGSGPVDEDSAAADTEAAVADADAAAVDAAVADTAAGRSVVVLVPAYNEADTIADVVLAARPYADAVVVIDDASDDETARIARECADGVVTHPVNLGVGAALHTGYRLALDEGFDVVVQLDGDGQHDPTHIPDLLAKMEETDADMVVGSRWLNSSHEEFAFVRRTGIRFFTMEANLLGNTDVTDITSGFRAYDASLLDELGRPANGHWALEQTLEVARNGHAIEEVSVPMQPDSEGSQFDLRTYAEYPARMALTTLKVLLFR